MFAKNSFHLLRSFHRERMGVSERDIITYAKQKTVVHIQQQLQQVEGRTFEV